MKEYTIKIKPFEILSILNFKSVQQMNEHGYVQLSARIRSDRKRNIYKRQRKETWVEIIGYDESGNEKAIFAVSFPSSVHLANWMAVLWICLFIPEAN